MFFSVFLCFSACRNKSVILALLGLSRDCPVSPLYCVCSALLLPCLPVSRLRSLIAGRSVCFRWSVRPCPFPPACRLRGFVVCRCRLPFACCAVWPCLALLGCRTSVRSASIEQIYETSVRVAFWLCLAEFPTESWPNINRISNRISTESWPNLGISVAECSTESEPNVWVSQDFILLAVCSLGVRCMIYVLVLVDC